MKLYQYNSILSIAEALVKEGYYIEAKNFLNSNEINVNKNTMKNSFANKAKLFQKIM